MRLSEAIRLGAMLKPQGFGSSSMYDPRRSCALGAASDAVGLALDSYRWLRLAKIWPQLDESYASPATRQVDRLLVVIYDLNDNRGWTRERIADWVETIEAAQAHAHPVSVAAVARVDHDQLVLTSRV